MHVAYNIQSLCVNVLCLFIEFMRVKELHHICLFFVIEKKHFYSRCATFCSGTNVVCCGLWKFCHDDVNDCINLIVSTQWSVLDRVGSQRQCYRCCKTEYHHRRQPELINHHALLWLAERFLWRHWFVNGPVNSLSVAILAPPVPLYNHSYRNIRVYQ